MDYSQPPPLEPVADMLERWRVEIEAAFMFRQRDGVAKTLRKHVNSANRVNRTDRSNRVTRGRLGRARLTAWDLLLDLEL